MTFAADVLPWCLSAAAVFSTYHVGKKTRWIFLFKLFAQIGWFYWIAATDNWGFLAMNLMFSVLYIRNHILWTRNLSYEQDKELDKEAREQS